MLMIYRLITREISGYDKFKIARILGLLGPRKPRNVM